MGLTVIMRLFRILDLDRGECKCQLKAFRGRAFEAAVWAVLLLCPFLPALIKHNRSEVRGWCEGCGRPCEPDPHQPLALCTKS